MVNIFMPQIILNRSSIIDLEQLNNNRKHGAVDGGELGRGFQLVPQL